MPVAIRRLIPLIAVLSLGAACGARVTPQEAHRKRTAADTSPLRPMRLVYDVRSISGLAESEEIVRTSDGNEWIVSSSSPSQTAEIRFDPVFRLTSYRAIPARFPATSLQFDGTRLHGRAPDMRRTIRYVSFPDGERPQVILCALAMIEGLPVLRAGFSMPAVFVNPYTQQLEKYSFEVKGTESITTAAGTFEAYRLEETSTRTVIHVRSAAPHIVLRLDAGGARLTSTHLWRDPEADRTISELRLVDDRTVMASPPCCR